MARYLYSELAKTQHIITNTSNKDFRDWQESYLEALAQWLPSGSGIDSGTKIDADATHNEKLTLTFGYHHMNDGGYYDGWTEHTAIVTPSFHSDFNLKITGRNRNGIKDYLYETFDHALRAECSIVFWQERLGDDCPKIKTRWIDSCHMVYDVHLPYATETFDPHASTERYTDWLASARACVVTWCDTYYWESGKAREIETVQTVQTEVR